MTKHNMEISLPFNKGGKESVLEFIYGISEKILESFPNFDNLIVIEVKNSLDDSGTYNSINYMVFKNLFEANSKINELMYTDYGVEVYIVDKIASCSIMYKRHDSMSYSRYAMVGTYPLNTDSIAAKLYNMKITVEIIN